MLKIMFNAEHRKFVVAEGADVFNHLFVKGDGWECTIRDDGMVRCACEMKDAKLHVKTIFYINQKGRLTFMKIRNGFKDRLFYYQIKNWPVDGQFILGDGPVEERKAFFLETEGVLDWQRKYGISDVKFEDPNGIQLLEFRYFEEERHFSIEHIETDGKVYFNDEDFGATLDLQEMYPGSKSFEHFEKIRVLGATWTIISKISTKESSRILYTLTDPMLLRNLPKGPKNVSEEGK